MIYVIKFNITTTYMVIFQNKYTYIIASFTCCIINMVLLMYSTISAYIPHSIGRLWWNHTRKLGGLNKKY